VSSTDLSRAETESLSLLLDNVIVIVMECTSESRGAFLVSCCSSEGIMPLILVQQALKYILRGVRIGADRVKMSIF